jgi:putative methionine-R-sulfoxide reductase with GAF domain
MLALENALKGIAEYATLVGKGDLDTAYQLLGENDAIGNALIEMQKSLRKTKTEQDKQKIEEEQRNWTTSGQAKFAEILRRNNDDMHDLSYNIVSEMVKYLGANQGGLFVLNDADANDMYLELMGCYAFDRKKFAERRINPGEGLTGACYLEGAPIYMTDIPDEYINITSGLGDASPKSLFICPLKVNDTVLGVIELASFAPFELYQREFVEKVSESIASTITSVRVTVRTNHLLEQNRLQTEEMRNMVEEMHQNMEEMQATQEESRRREAELLETIERMKQK